MFADWSTAPLEEADRALAEFAVDLTLHPSGEPDRRLAGLRAHGFADDEILRATEITGYFNFVNRMAEGLGVKLEESFE